MQEHSKGPECAWGSSPRGKKLGPILSRRKGTNGARTYKTTRLSWEPETSNPGG